MADDEIVPSGIRRELSLWHAELVGTIREQQAGETGSMSGAQCASGEARAVERHRGTPARLTAACAKSRVVSVTG